MLRAASLALYAALAILGEATVARPALLWLRSQGFLHPEAGWTIPLGAWHLTLALALGAFTVALAVAAALKRRRTLPAHAAFLCLVAACIALRSASGDPAPPADPAPALLDALRLAADELDARYQGRYLPDAGLLTSALAASPPTGFRRFGRAIRTHARVLSGSAGPQLDPLPEDLPGTIYAAISPDRQTAWLTALTLRDGRAAVFEIAPGKPAVAEARAGTHTLPGRDRLVPAYPGARSATGN